MTSKGVPLRPPWCSEKVPVFVLRLRRTSTFGAANVWVKFNALPEGDGVKVQFFRS